MAKDFDTQETRLAFRRLLRRPKYRFMVANRIIPHLPWLVLMSLAVYLYKARIFADSGFYVAQFINNQTLWIECQRIVLAISQIIPLVGVWLGVELKYVLILYSISHIVFFYVLFLFVYYGLRDRRSGLLIILAQTVGIMHSFYTPMFELYYGVPLLITFYAIWRLPFRYNAIFVLLIMEVLILLSHPLAFILFVFVLLFDYKRETAKPLKYYLPVALVYFGAVVFKYFVMCEYESGKMAWQFNYADNKQYLQLISPSYYKVLVLFMLRYYAEVLIALVIVVYMFVTRKEWFRLLLVAGTFAGYLFLVNSAYTVSHSRYMEQVMFPFIPIVFIPLVYGFNQQKRQGLQNIGVLVVSALIIYRLAVIYSGSDIFIKRIAQMEQLIEAARQKGGSKFVVSQYNVDHGYTQLNWSYPLETMLLSAIDGNDITVTIAPEDDLYFEGNNTKMKAGQFIFRKWELKDQSWLNKRYFHLDIGPYRKLNDTLPNANVASIPANVRVSIHAKSIYRAMDTVWVPVSISNLGRTPVYSGEKNHVFLSYFWVENNNVLNWDGIRTPLQADVTGTFNQHVKVAVPRTKGRLKLKVDIIINDQWLGLSSQDDVLVY